MLMREWWAIVRNQISTSDCKYKFVKVFLIQTFELIPKILRSLTFLDSLLKRFS